MSARTDKSNLKPKTDKKVREVGRSREARGFGAVSPERKDGLCSSAQSNLNVADAFSAEDRERKITLQVGDAAPEFELENADGVKISLKDFVGKKVVLYFYPKDMTPGCTTEACEFSDEFIHFVDKGAFVVGVSPDSVASHEKFAAAKDLKHVLLSDPEKEVAKKYGVWQVRKNYGKEYLGIVRTTFVIDEKGKIAKIYKSVKAAGHAKKVLSDLG